MQNKKEKKNELDQVPDIHQWITVRGAREHNLKNITVSIPKNAFTVITGPSGSGKSSLALDVLYAEGQRRYMESLGSYARQFLGMPQKPAVDAIYGLCPSIAIEQKTVGANPRSTVGTITELYDYLRVLYARIGVPHCVGCDVVLEAIAPDALIKKIISRHQGLYITIMAPVVIQKKGTFLSELELWFAAGWRRFVIDGHECRFARKEEIVALRLQKNYKHSISIVLNTLELTVDMYDDLQEAVLQSLALSSGRVLIKEGDGEVLYATQAACVSCGHTVPDLEPRLFSFNSPLGACTKCEGLGAIVDLPWNFANSTLAGLEFAQRMGVYHEIPCPECHGARLKKEMLAVTVGGRNIAQWSALSVQDGLRAIQSLTLTVHEQNIIERLRYEIQARYQFLLDVGLGYLSLDRSARTLSGGEGQRIRLATQIGSGLTGVLYVLDEPSIGLHQRDNDRLIATLKNLRDQGNTVLVVEHDIDTMKSADYLIDMGPAAGIHGGHVVGYGKPAEIIEQKTSVTGPYLAGKKKIERLSALRHSNNFLTIYGVTAHNLKGMDVAFPLGLLCGISGVSGSGKSSLIMDELVPRLERALAGHKKSADFTHSISGYEALDFMVTIDQKPIGRTSRSNPATYLGIFDDIRKLFASLPESNLRGFDVGHFSFNMNKGRCPKCSGEGQITVSMHFLPDVTVICDACNGLRYQEQILQIRYNDASIADVLAMTAEQARIFFNAHAGLHKKIQLLCDVGLEYIALGQPSTTLSGGESQRIKLAYELSKRGKKTLYVLDEPTTGLHAQDIIKLLGVFERLLERGNSIIVIEHNIDVLRICDYLIDLGPEGGSQGGSIVAYGTPDQVAQSKESRTAPYLR